jgi:hypothetical protein
MAGAHRPVKRFCHTLLRLCIGGVFVYAGALKIADPMAFADSVATFRLLPHAIISPFVLTLPTYEVLLGTLLVLNRTVRAASLGVLILSTLFAAGLGTALIRGLSIDCGCFGSSRWSSNTWLLLARAIVLGAASSAIYLNAVKAIGRVRKPSKF